MLTQEFLADMLGVRRATVTEAAGLLRKDKLIEYRLGRIQVMDREGLEGAACECYRILRDQFDRLGKNGKQLRDDPIRNDNPKAFYSAGPWMFGAD